MNAAQAGESAAAQNMRQHGFSLIVLCMARRDGIAVTFRSLYCEELVAGGAGGLFDISC